MPVLRMEEERGTFMKKIAVCNSSAVYMLLMLLLHLQYSGNYSVIGFVVFCGVALLWFLSLVPIGLKIIGFQLGKQLLMADFFIRFAQIVVVFFLCSYKPFSFLTCVSVLLLMEVADLIVLLYLFPTEIDNTITLESVKKKNKKDNDIHGATDAILQKPLYLLFPPIVLSVLNITNRPYLLLASMLAFGLEFFIVHTIVKEMCKCGYISVKKKHILWLISVPILSCMLISLFVDERDVLYYALNFVHYVTVQTYVGKCIHRK